MLGLEKFEAKTFDCVTLIKLKILNEFNFKNIHKL